MQSRRIAFTNAAAALIIAVALTSVTALLAQTETGQIVGTVLDPANAVIPNAMITAVEQVTQTKRSTVSSAAGSYAFTNLLPGVWQLTATAGNFQTLKQNVVVTVGATSTADLHMTVGTETTVVEVRKRLYRSIRQPKRSTRRSRVISSGSSRT